jgi:diacylglycerol kinase family enzyme
VPHALIIGTSLAGHGGPSALRLVTDTLVRGGWRVDTLLATDKASLSRSAAEGVEREVDVIAAIGGDGTILQVAGALVGSDVRLAIIPTGTGNLLAGNLDLASGVEAAARTILAGRSRRIDLGRLMGDVVGSNGLHFAVACGIGFDARVMGATSVGLKRIFGKFAYVATAAALSPSLRNEAYDVRVDGVDYAAPGAQVFVANFGRLARRVEATWPIRPDDGVLDIIVMNASGPVSGVLAAWGAIRHGHIHRSIHGVLHLQGGEIRIASRSPQVAEADGDVIGWTPVVVKVVPRALSVVVPVA